MLSSSLFRSFADTKSTTSLKILRHQPGVSMRTDCLYGVFNVRVASRMRGEDFTMYHCSYGHDNLPGTYIGETTTQLRYILFDR